mmetsp:Transcript_23724/g.67003  ORF Transcript_23724/g.67003 Transcript_23724/m.67003 type:complete len:574 (+) Transcript_23724:859-2580(+)
MDKLKKRSNTKTSLRRSAHGGNDDDSNRSLSHHDEISEHGAADIDEEEATCKNPYLKVNASIGSGAKKNARKKRKRSTSLWAIWIGSLVLCVAWFIFLSRWTMDQDPTKDHRAYYFGSNEEGRHAMNAATNAMLHAPRELFHRIEKPLLILTNAIHQPTYLPQRSRTIGMYFESSRSVGPVGVETLDPNMIRRVLRQPHSFLGFPDTSEGRKAQKHLQDSDDYYWGQKDEVETDECELQYEWQKQTITTCNHVMEQDLTHVDMDDDSHHWPIRFLAHGYWRDVWRVRRPLHDDDYGGRSVLKTMRYEHDFTERNYDRHRRDSMAMEHLSSSPHIMNIYAFCGNSGLFEFANGGSVDDIAYDKEVMKGYSSRDKVAMAHQLASGLSAVHNIDKVGVPSISHTDITGSQFVLVEQAGIYKLNDFNRARFLTKNRETGESCTFSVGNNPGSFRSPEEYTEPHVQTEKIDVYSLGNIFYGILTSLTPFEDISDSADIQKKIRHGKQPPIADKFKNSKDPYIKALLKVIGMCWVQDPKARSSSREVMDYLEQRLVELGEGGSSGEEEEGEKEDAGKRK